MTLIEELKYRGFLHQCTDEESLNKKLKSENITFYIGFDCTAKSLHIGSLIQIMIMRLFQKYGHTPIILIGTGTTRIGDPSGKDETRKILTDDEIKNNANNLKTVFDKYLSFKNEENKALVMDNADWLDKLSYVDFLRDFGKHFTINKMLTFDSVKIRLEREQSLSFVEFNYMIFQAYDFYELNNRNSCTLQIGGSDQWGNIVNGVELIRRVNGKEVFGLTTPLLTNSSGNKMGKTDDGAIWLNNDLLSAYNNWTYWSNGKMASCKIRVASDHSLKGCGSEADTMTHEIGHCIGFFNHTADGGLMDETAAGSSEITSPVRNMISLLYSLSPGTNINSKLRSPSAKRRSKSNKYDPAGTRLYSGSSYFMKNGEVKIVPDW